MHFLPSLQDGLKLQGGDIVALNFRRIFRRSGKCLVEMVQTVRGLAEWMPQRAESVTKCYSWECFENDSEEAFEPMREPYNTALLLFQIGQFL